MDRTPPNSVSAESAVLGAILIGGQAVAAQVLPNLGNQDFYRHEHQLVYRAIEDQARVGEVDAVSISHRLADDVPNAHQRLAELALSTPTQSNAMVYVDIIRDMKTRRDLIASTMRITAGAYDTKIDTATVIEGATKLILRAVDTGDTVQIDDAMAAMVRTLEAEFDGEITSVRTGFKAIDDRIGGYRPGTYNLLAARPGMGKTALALNVAENAAEGGSRVLIFSMEMGSEELAGRVASSVGRLPYRTIANPRKHMEDEHWPRLTSAVERTTDKAITIVDRAGLTVGQIQSLIMLQQLRGGVDLVIIDHLGLMGGEGNLYAQTSTNSRQLKIIAKNLQVPLLVLSQLNRGVENRDDKRPKLSDLRESGALEEDADTIAFLYRDGYYNEDSPHKHIAELNMAKVRNGETGKSYLKEELHLMTFSDYLGEVPAINVKERVELP